MSDTRTETDSLGTIEVPGDALYGAQTQRALNNFKISNLVMPPVFITALAQIKQAAAVANLQLGLLEEEIANAITSACQEIAAGKHRQYFPVDVFQTGSGTSSNMNANEVIANLASDLSDSTVSPNDHVNMGQSSNDVIPTTINVSAAMLVHHSLLPSLQRLRQILDKKSQSVQDVIKTGRTHLMDAMPIRMSQELDAWACQISDQIESINSFLPRLQAISQGGTAVGTGINAHPDFPRLFAEELKSITEIDFTPSKNFFVGISSQDTSVALSGQLKSLAIVLMKIANDLRWMNSGPLAGLGEIELEALQPGSSIMPGKVNPVIPEAVAMTASQVIGNDTTVSIAGQSSNFQLNVMLPVIAYNIIQSIELLSNAAVHLGEGAIANFKVNHASIELALSRNPILVTALNPIIGYAKAAQIAKKAYASGRAILEVAEEETDIERSELERLLDPKKLTQGGIQEKLP